MQDITIIHIGFKKVSGINGQVMSDYEIIFRLVRNAECRLQTWFQLFKGWIAFNPLDKH